MRLEDYPRPSVAVDTAILTVANGTLCAAIVHRDGGRRLPGTFLHEGELLAEAVARSLQDRTGLTGLAPRQLHVFDALDRDDRGRVLSVAHLIALPAEELRDVELVPVEDAHGLDFDHDEMVVFAVEEMRRAYRERPDPEELLGAEFTILDLHKLHSAVDPSAPHKDTFRRAMMPHLRPLNRLQEGVVGKPAQLFTRR
jgi:8-oxo-dGTP diphosphatase